MRRSVRVPASAVAVAALSLSAGCTGHAKDTARASGLRTTGVVMLKAYDPASGVLRYQGTKKVQEPDEAILPDGPISAATVAKDAKVFSAVNICSGDDATVDDKTGIGVKPCTLAQLDAALRDEAQIDAYLTIDGGRVVKIAEVYHP